MEDLKLAKQLVKALDRAIMREREAQNFYMNQATNSYEYDVKKLFKQLVHEEIGHERLLTAKKIAVQKDIARLEKKK
ncbi:MAG TPA: ferritin family protein [Candidatus Edwardsbacteria bacterium]|nr:ferritin family protein [Candidatus Edwardsbacteria bacterium]